MFNWLFGKKTPPINSRSVTDLHEDDSDIGPNFTLHSGDIFGPSSKSPNGKYKIICKDSNGRIGGHREAGNGTYYLLHENKLVYTGSLERPNNGKIANNGTATIEDWKFGSNLNGTFVAIDINGTQLIKRDFQANILNSGISSDGRFATCQTGNAPDSPDNSILAIFDLISGKEIGTFSPESGWVDAYEFSDDGTITLVQRDLGKFRYTLSGEFIDKPLWQQAILDQAEVRAIYLIKQMLQEDPPSLERATAFIKNLDNIIVKLDTSDKWHRADAWRLKGELLESQNQIEEALSCYDQALSCNPKVGIKRHADALRKNISGATT